LGEKSWLRVSKKRFKFGKFFNKMIFGLLGFLDECIRNLLVDSFKIFKKNRFHIDQIDDTAKVAAYADRLLKSHRIGIQLFIELP